MSATEKRPQRSSFNLVAAKILRECGELLRRQQANPFRVNAYVHAAQTLESLSVDARTILRENGIDGLIELPAIGPGLAASIDEIARTGRLSRLDRLRGTAKPEDLFQTVPGVGPTLAQRIHDRLHVETLEGLEIAANDGRLAAVPGFGPRRAAAIRLALASMLGRAGAGPRRAETGEPPVRLLLDVDRRYREAAAAGSLPTLAPRRFNPEGKAWLPILHLSRHGWHFTALYSNTAKAHELGRTRDWVVIYFHDDGHREGQNTVVTETHGPLEGRRVVRGREGECASAHRASAG